MNEVDVFARVVIVDLEITALNISLAQKIKVIYFDPV